MAALHLHGSSGARTPGYRLLLLALGYSPVATWCVQALLGVLATLLVYALARRLGASARLALAAGLLYALDLEVLAIEHIVLTETLTSFLLLVAAHLAISIAGRERPRARRWQCSDWCWRTCAWCDRTSSRSTVYLAVALAVAVAIARRGPGATVGRRQRARRDGC